MTAPTGPLCDVRVLDLTSVVMGPLATQILGDLGADVISVEDLAGDLSRSLGLGPHPQLSGVSLNLLRNKRNVSLDLKHPDGREAFLRLAETADIIVTNLRPGPLARLGLTYYEVRARKPDIIYCQAQGLLHEFIHVSFETVDLRAPGNIFINGFWEWVRLLKDHADLAAHFHRVNIPAI